MKKWVTVVGLLIGGWLAPTQTKAQENWNDGRLVLTNQQVLEGDINYNWKAEVVQVKTDGRIRAFSSSQVAGFDFYDMQNNMLRHFVSLEVPVREKNRKLLVEKIMEGPYTVFRRLRNGRVLFRLSQPRMYSSDSNLLKDDSNFDYLVQTQAGFIKLDEFQHQVMPNLMSSEMGPQIRRYISTHQLNPHSTTTRLMLLLRYNALTEDALQQQEQQRRGVSGE